MQFDLLIKGGEVVDPGGGHSGRLDVAVKRNRIAAVDADIPVESAPQVIDASGQFVTPGLVDLHTHIFYGIGYYGVHADTVAARSGVTTWLDVGSSGGYNFPGLQRIHRHSRSSTHLCVNQYFIHRLDNAVRGTHQLGLLRYRSLLQNDKSEPRYSVGRKSTYRSRSNRRAQSFH